MPDRKMTAAEIKKPADSNAEESKQPLIVFEDVTLRIRDRHILPSTGWRIQKDENWVVLGPNGAGKSTLMRALTGDTPVVGGRIRRCGLAAQTDAIGFVSFELHQRIIAREQVREEARHFSGNINGCLTVEEFIEEGRSRPVNNRLTVSQLLSAFGVGELMPRSIQKLSNGEMRKILIFKAVMRARRLLVLDEPFAGLDRRSREQLKAAIDTLIRSGMQIVLATHRHENILPAFSHVICLKAGRVLCQGRRDQVLIPEKIRRVRGPNSITSSGHAERTNPDCARDAPVVIDVRHVAVRYGGRCVFSDLSWKVHRGENWAVIGPNGSGKTTLLQLISADHPQAYANEIVLFGRKRGSGESIWEIKGRLGMVSSEFQINYRKPIRAEEVVLSGFFSSVGLYRRASREQRNTAREWIHRMKLSHLKARRYDLLSYGERRMILLARAMVKSPEILIMDEPCQGLDIVYRKRILDLIDDVCGHARTQLIYVTHHLDEMPGCISHILDLATQRSMRR